jgi:hypothetical protein
VICPCKGSITIQVFMVCSTHKARLPTSRAIMHFLDFPIVWSRLDVLHLVKCKILDGDQHSINYKSECGGHSSTPHTSTTSPTRVSVISPYRLSKPRTRLDDWAVQQQNWPIPRIQRKSSKRCWALEIFLPVMSRPSWYSVPHA